MKFQPDTLDGVNAITRAEPTRLWVGATAFTRSVLVPWRGTVQAWPVAQMADLQAASFDAVLELAPEVVILGTGAVLRFPHPSLLRPLFERRIGVESMDTAAAVRTYNVLVNEGRRVAGAFILA